MLAYLGLGSNEGDSLAALRAATRALRRYGVEVLKASSVWETAPQGEVLDQADFLNACLSVEASLGPEELLGVCKAVERDGGRAPGAEKHGPRPIDVDVLLVDGVEHRSERMVLPHPAIPNRRFVLEPLFELDPELRLPDGTALAPMLDAVRDQRVTRREPLLPRSD